VPFCATSLRRALIRLRSWEEQEVTEEQPEQERFCADFRQRLKELVWKPREMSRKKTVKGKAAASSPSAGSPTGKWAGRTARSSPAMVPLNGVVHPSGPAVSSSSEFYDIAFKVSPQSSSSLRPRASRIAAPKLLPPRASEQPLADVLAALFLSPVQVMLVGDSGVGKTCLLVRFKDAAFLAGSFISTVGIDFRVSLFGL
ncbi:Ras-related protein, partial [Takifugu flavidus]